MLEKKLNDDPEDKYAQACVEGNEEKYEESHLDLELPLCFMNERHLIQTKSYETPVKRNWRKKDRVSKIFILVK